MKKIYILLLFIAMAGCKESNREAEDSQAEDSLAVAEREYKVLDSRFLNKESIWEPFNAALETISENRYGVLSPMILDKTIPELQQAIKRGDFTYEELVLFYLHRIKKLDRNNAKSLNSVIALNPNVIEEARSRDSDLQAGRLEKHPAFGIPVLLKDNINTKDMPTTAGAVALSDNRTQDAFIVEQLRKNGAVILGKANLSEWAYFFCGDCPSGYSAVGGQTLNPYGRKILDTGGSSSGSAVAVAANFAPAAIGSETSGSILSPSSQNSLVGLKPTIGVLSRGGIVPISSTLDTPGPITKSVIDNAIIFSAMTGRDSKDPASRNNTNDEKDFYTNISQNSLKGKRLGAMKTLMEDPLYSAAVDDLRKAGAEVIIYEPEEVELPNFLRLLNLDMKKDLPDYLENYGGKLEVRNVEDVVVYNLADTSARAPYGQALFEGILKDSATPEEFEAIKDTLRQNGRRFFDIPMEEHDLDAILSINNYHASFGAVAHYPAITVPMGYGKNNAPKGLTFFAKPFQEASLYSLAYGFEQATKKRVSPQNYAD